MTEPTTQTLVELRRLAEAAKGAKLPYSVAAKKALLEFQCEAVPSQIIELLDAIEAQAREIERLEALHVTTMMDELQPALEERNALRTQVEAQAREIERLTNNFKVNLAAMHKAANERDAFKAELAAIRAQEPVLVVEKEPEYWSGGHFHQGTQPYVDRTKVWNLKIGTKLYAAPVAAPVVDVNAGLVDTLFEIFQGWSSATFGWQDSSDPDVEAANFAKAKQDHRNECKRRLTAALSTARTQASQPQQKAGE